MNDTDPKPKNRRPLWIALLVLLALLILGGSTALIYLHRWRAGQWKPGPALKQTLLEVTNTDELYRRAKALKADLQDLGDALKELDLSAAQKARARMLADRDALRREMDAPALAAASLSPELREELKGAEELLAILDEADEALLAPGLALLEENPLSDLNTEDGVRVDKLLLYLDFLETALPRVEPLLDRAESVDLRLLDSDGKLSAALEKLAPWRETARELQSWLPAIRAVLGDGADRLYLFAAQNSSEIRASGGFPGSVGLVRIRDGLLTVSDFESVYNMLVRDTPRRALITPEEDELFGGRMRLSWDSDFSPDFERVAAIWALAYEDYHASPVDGVFSCTPAVIPRLLEVLGEVELSDGTVLDAENAGRVLGHDLYFSYMGADWQPGAAAKVDGLFAEAARSTLNLLFSKLNGKTLKELLPLFRDSIADRTVMLWLADEAAQAKVRAVGWDAGLNRDPLKPEAGVFFNSTESSKMAWFLDLDTELSEPETNEDGSLSYTLTVTLANTISQEELYAAGGYILGTSKGAIVGSLYLFAPAGGRIEEAVADNGQALKTAQYEGLQLAWLSKLLIWGEQPVTVRCRITTAPGAAPLELMTTPTMQEYR